MPVAEERVDRTGEEDVRECAGHGGIPRRAELHLDGRVVEDATDHFGVAFFGNPLVGAVVIIVVVAEPHGQALEDGGRQIARFAAPLLLGVAVKEGLVKFAANEFQGLLFEILRLPNGLVAFGGDELGGFLGSEAHAEDLIDGMEIDREGENTA